LAPQSIQPTFEAAESSRGMRWVCRFLRGAHRGATRSAAVVSILVLALLPALLPQAAYAEPDSPWVGHWTAIHPDPAVPDARMNITRNGAHGFKVRIENPQDGLFCDGAGVRARGHGDLSTAINMTVAFEFRCDTAVEGEQSVTLLLNLSNPHGILEVADSSGHVWTRMP